jgi:streptomycin 3"-adenylyltransferase
MTNTDTPEMKQQLKESLELLKMILGADLSGVYLYGSSLVGGLQRYSDIDLFVVTNRSTTIEEKRRLVTRLLQIPGIYMQGTKRPIEMTLVEKTAINPWNYPAQFDFQYGEWLRASFETGHIEPWATYEMPDLALIITQILLKNHTLFGLDSKQLLPDVPWRDYINALLFDQSRLGTDLEHDTRNVLLTYARTWSTLKTNVFRSKPDAADWAIHHLPKEHQPVMQRAKLICMGVENEHWDDIHSLVKPCAEFMINQIHQASLLVNLNDPENIIRLAE